MSEDDTAHAELRRRVDLTVMAELDQMRAEMPYADILELRLICERRDA